MSTDARSRQPKGQPTGGQFAPSTKADDQVDSLNEPERAIPDLDGWRQHVVRQTQAVAVRDLSEAVLGEALNDFGLELDYDSIDAEIKARVPRIVELMQSTSVAVRRSEDDQLYGHLDREEFAFEAERLEAELTTAWAELGSIVGQKSA